MTTVRFLGDLPFWMGIALSLLVGALSWRYYTRESFRLPPHLQWLLPLLRSAAFFLGIMLLTGPVLHHRQTTGELGNVHIYLDASQSMGLRDPHMSTSRKLRIAEQLGWLEAAYVDDPLSLAADELAAIDLTLQDQEVTASVSSGDRPTTPALLKRIQDLQPTLPDNLRQRIAFEIVQPLQRLSDDRSAQPTPAEQLSELHKAFQTIENLLRDAADQSLQSKMNSSDPSLRSALALFDETPRWQRLLQTLNGSSGDVLDQLQTQHHVEIRTLTNQPVDLSHFETGEATDRVPKVAPTEPFTDLSSSLISSQKGGTATADNSAAKLSQTAIVLFTDGQHNAGPSPLQTARILGGQGIPLYCVSIGAEHSAEDLSLVDVEHPEMVFAKDQVRGTVTFRETMPPGKPFTLQIQHENEVLWQQQLVTQEAAERNVEFEFTIADIVERLDQQFTTNYTQHAIPLKFKVAILPLAEEYETENNSREFRLAAVVQSQRVLILDGRSRWEIRYLRNVFTRDDRWHVDTVIAGTATADQQLPRGEQRDQFPNERDELFRYDLIIWGEISPALFASHELEWIREFAEVRGGGVIFIDSSRQALRELADHVLVDLLPIDWQDKRDIPASATLRLTETGASTPALQLTADEQSNRRFWTELPPPQTFSAVKAVPGAEVLMEIASTDSVHPALIMRQFGAGRVLYFAFDETWRWRYKAADIWHQRIWNQLATFAMPRPFTVSDEYVSLDTGPVSYQSGEQVDVRVRLRGLDGKPVLDATVDAILWKDNRVVSNVRLNADRRVPGLYQGRSTKLAAGDYEVSVRAAGYSDAALQARSKLSVLPPQTAELQQTAVNKTLLTQIARESNGKYLREEELYQLPELLRPFSAGRVIETETPIWQSYWWFAAMIGLLTWEWILRKRAGLL